jgi:tricorn protease interacting factor F2/3
MQNLEAVNYKLRLEPDLTNFLFAGTAEILLNAQAPLKEIAVNILEIAIWSCEVIQKDNHVACPFLVDSQKELLRIFLPEAMSGEILLNIVYQGHINNKMAGFYRSKYVRRSKTRYIAVTQFEESDARRAFPCMDHPAKKATFDIEIDISPKLIAISNSAIKEKIMLDNGKCRVVFERTPKMSTYLVFLGIGEFEFTVDKKDARVRVATLPNMKKYSRLGLEFGRKSLQFSESYYKIPYPLPKLDLIAIPDFAFGAMENWGAVTFRENLLLHYPNITSKSGKERICEVIAHEIAHQWFGNLVTPSDWRYLWLNESFATYFGYGIVDHYYPQWDTWKQFLQGQTGSAMERDSLHETFAIEIPGGEHVVINASTAPIIYSKGGSILRQIHGYIGDGNFRKGLQHYLKSFEYECAASHHLWESFEKISHQPISAMMKSWIEQPGFPVVEVDRVGNGLVLAQKKFTYLPNKSNQKWMIPVTLDLYAENGNAQQQTILLDRVKKKVKLDQKTVAYKLNARQNGFYRVKYKDLENLQKLGQRVRNKILPPEDRWGLQNDLFALVKSGAVTFDKYLEFLSFYENEEDYLPLSSIAANLYQGFRIFKKKRRDQIAALAKPWFERLLEKIGYAPAAREKHTISILRDQLVWDAALYGSQTVREFTTKQFSALVKGKFIHPDIMKSVLQVGAFLSNKGRFNWFDQRLQSSQIEHERMNILIALGCFKDKNLIRRSQKYVLQNVPARNKFIPVVAMAANPFAVPLMWDWYVANLEQIEQFHPMLYERVVAAIIPTSGLHKTKTVQRFFKDYMAKTDKAKDVIKLSLERLEINIRMRKLN